MARDHRLDLDWLTEAAWTYVGDSVWEPLAPPDNDDTGLDTAADALVELLSALVRRQHEHRSRTAARLTTVIDSRLLPDDLDFVEAMHHQLSSRHYVPMGVEWVLLGIWADRVGRLKMPYDIVSMYRDLTHEDVMRALDTVRDAQIHTAARLLQESRVLDGVAREHKVLAAISALEQAVELCLENRRPRTAPRAVEAHLLLAGCYAALGKDTRSVVANVYRGHQWFMWLACRKGVVPAVVANSRQAVELTWSFTYGIPSADELARTGIAQTPWGASWTPGDDWVLASDIYPLLNTSQLASAWDDFRTVANRLVAAAFTPAQPTSPDGSRMSGGSAELSPHRGRLSPATATPVLSLDLVYPTL